MFRKKVIKRCPRGHRMDLAWRACPRCTGRTATGLAARELTEQTIVADVAEVAVDATRVLTPEEIDRELANARLQVLAGPLAGQELNLLPGLNHIGKAPRASPAAHEIAVPADRHMSRDHAVLEFRNGQLHLTDAGSMNGTFVNGERIQRTVLRERDEVRMGESVFRFVLRT